MERKREDEHIDPQSLSAGYNAGVLLKLQYAFAANPDTDLFSIFPKTLLCKLEQI